MQSEYQWRKESEKRLEFAKENIRRITEIRNYIQKMRYATIKLEKLDKDFEPVEYGRYTDVEKTIRELVEGGIERTGVFFITNIWILKDEVYNYLVSFAFRIDRYGKTIEDALVFGQELYSLKDTVLNDIKPNTLFFIVSCGRNVEMKSVSLNDKVRVANIYKLKGIYVYELHKEVIEFLESFWWDEKPDWLDINERFKV
jgi:hypothetical protein